MTSHMVREFKIILMVVDIRETSRKGSNMVKGSILSVMARFIKVNSIRVNFLKVD